MKLKLIIFIFLFPLFASGQVQTHESRLIPATGGSGEEEILQQSTEPARVLDRLWRNSVDSSLKYYDKNLLRFIDIRLDYYLSDFQGPGITDSTALTEAIALAMPFSVIHVPKDTFFFSKHMNLIINKSLTIKGVHGSYFDIEGHSNNVGFFQINADDVTLENIGFTSDESFANVSEPLVSNSNITPINCNTVSVQRFTLKDCEFYNMGKGTDFESSKNLRFIDNSFYQCGTDILLDADTAVLISGNYSDRSSHNPAGGLIHHLYLDDVVNFVVQNGTAIGGAGRPINIKTSGLPVYPHKGVVSNYYIEDANAVFLSYADNIVIENTRWVNSPGVQGSNLAQAEIINPQWVNTDTSYQYFFTQENWNNNGADSAIVSVIGGTLEGATRIGANYTKGLNFIGTTFINPIDTSTTQDVFFGNANATPSVVRLTDCKFYFTHSLGSGSPRLFRFDEAQPYVKNCSFDAVGSASLSYLSLSSKSGTETDYFIDCTISGNISGFIWPSSTTNSFRLINCKRESDYFPVREMYTDKTTDYTSRGESFLGMNSSNTLTLSTADAGFPFWTIDVISTDSTAITIDTEGSETINGQSTYTTYNHVQLMADTSGNWITTGQGIGDNGLASLWSANGTKVYYNGGNIGLGTNDPSSLLHLQIQGSRDPIVYAQAPDGGSVIGGFKTGAGSGGTQGGIEMATARGAKSSVSTVGVFNSYITTLNATDLLIATNTTERFRIKSDGKIGFGTTSPQEDIHFGSGIDLRIEDITSAYRLGTDSNGKIQSSTPSYGFMAFADSSLTITATGSGTYDVITNPGNDLFSLTGQSGDIVVDGDSITINCTCAVEFDVEFSLSAGSGSTYRVKFLKAGAKIPNVGFEIDLSNTDTRNGGFTYIYSAVSGDVIKPAFEETAGTTDPTFIAGSISVNRK